MHRTGVVVMVMLLGASATAAEPDPRAEALNEDGKAQYNEQGDYETAAARFRAAIVISPDPRYFFNLCNALEKLGQIDAALAACDAVQTHHPAPALAAKAKKRSADLARARPVPSPSAPPEEPIFDDPASGYRWALGADLGGLSDRNLGDDYFSRGGPALRLRADFLILPRDHVGVQLYADFFYLGGKPDASGLKRDLSDFNLGAAIELHVRLADRLLFTPLAGLHFSVLQPYTGDHDESFLTIGVRLQLGLDYVFAGGNHVVSFAPLSFYAWAPARQLAGALGGSEVFGFDHPGTAIAVTVGYTYRFTGPGRSFVLE